VRGAVVRKGPEPDGDLGDDPERALGADHEPDQVVSRDALGRPPTEPDDLSGCRHHFEREHVVARHPVLEAAQPAGVGGDVAADGRPRRAGRVGRIPQQLLGGSGAEIVVHDPGLHDGKPLSRVDLDDLPHELGGQGDSTVDRVGPAG